MPELPEVEIYRRQFEEVALAQTIASVKAENEGRMIPQGVEHLQESLIGQRFEGTERVGKFLFIRLTNGEFLLWHFGLTGSFTYFKEEEMRHRFARIWVYFENGWILTFNSLRKFSRMEVTPTIEELLSRRKIGPDVLRMSTEDFTHSLIRRRVNIKAALLEQKKFAGIGNWIADEMLFQTCIHPETPCDQLTEQQYAHLHQWVKDIIQTTLDYDADYANFPEHYLVRVRRDGEKCPRCEQELKRLVVAGRGTFICEKDQR